MKSERLDQLISAVDGLHSAAFADESGAVTAESSGFEGDVPCAVAAICRGQLEELGRLVGATKVKDWSLAASRMNVYVVNQGNESLIALGDHDDKPAKVAEKIAAFLG